MRLRAAFFSAAVATAFLATPLFGQSTFRIWNYVPGVGLDAPVFDASGNRLSETNYLVSLYGGRDSNALQLATVEDTVVTGHPVFMAPIPFNYRPRGLDGYFIGPYYVTVDSEFAGRETWLQLRAWDAHLGPSYESVFALGIGGVR